MDTETTQHHRMNNREKLCLLAILLLAAALRLIRLGTFPFWADEAFNLVISQDLAGVFFEGNFACNHPPMPYVLLALWRAAGLGINEWTIRALPACFGIAGVAAIFWLGRQMFSIRVGLTAAFLLAIAPFHVLHSQDLKEYIYLPFFATLMAGFFYRGLKSNHWRDWMLYGLLAGISCYTEIFVVPLLLTFNFWFLVIANTYRDRIKKWFWANAFGALLFLPWAGIMLQKIQTYMLDAENWWVPAPTLLSVAFYFKTIAYGYTAACKPCFYMAFLLFAFLFAWGSWQALKLNRRAGTMLVLWSTVPVVLVFFLSFISESIFLIRAMIPFSIGVYLLAAIGITSLKDKRLHAVTLVLVVLLCGAGLTTYYVRIYHPMQHPHRPGIHPPRDYDKAAQYVLANMKEGDIVVHASQNTWLPFNWYGFHGIPHFVGGMHQDFVNSIISGNPITTTNPELLRLWPKVIDEIVPGHKRIWYVFCEWERNYLPGNAMHVWRWLDSHFSETEQHSFKGIEVILYVTPESEDYAQAIERNHDTGITAEVHYAGWDRPYTKTVPDSSLEPVPLENRKGHLFLSFSDAEPAEELNSNSGRAISFSVENTSDISARCAISLIASEALIPFASFQKTAPQVMTWQVVSMYNHTPPPPEYNLSVLTANLNYGPGAATGSISLPAGNYIPLIFMIAPYNNYEFWAAPLDIQFGNTKFAIDPSLQLQKPGQWNWVQGNPLQITDPQPLPIKVESQTLSQDRPGYANLAYIAFVRTPQGMTQWSRQATIPAKNTEMWNVTTSSTVKRVDIWIYEQGEDGQAYYIFRRFVS